MPFVNKKYLAVLLLLGFAAACVSAADAGRTTDAPPPAGRPVTREQAMAIALDRSNGGTVVEIEVDRGRGGQIFYEFEIVDNGVRFEIEIDGSDGSITEFERQRISSSDRPFARPGMSVAEAEAVAVRHVGGGEVVKYELERERGALVHEVTVLKDRIRHRLEINDADGQVVGSR